MMSDIKVSSRISMEKWQQSRHWSPGNGTFQNFFCYCWMNNPFFTKAYGLIIRQYRINLT